MAQGSAHIGKDRYRTEIVVGGHAITADEPLLYKGEDFAHTDVRPAVRVL